MFDAQLEALASQRRVIAWDARGHGETPDDGESFTYWDHAKDLFSLMDVLGIESATVGGVSQGGFTAMRAALLAPDRVDALLLFDTEATPVDPGDKIAYSQLFASLREQGPIDDLLKSLAGMLIGDHPAADLWIEKWRHSELPLGAPAECLLERDNVLPEMGKIRRPVLLARGSADGSLPEERMLAIADQLPGDTRLEVIQGAGHSPPMTHPAEVNALLEQFLAGVPVAGAARRPA